MTLIPDDKAIKPSSIVDEMARAVSDRVACDCRQAGYPTDEGPCAACIADAQCAAAIVARHLREASKSGFGPAVLALIDELEGRMDTNEGSE